MTDSVEHKRPVRVQQDPVLARDRVMSRRKDWTPFALRFPFLVFIIVVLQLCTAGLEVLLRHSAPLPVDVSASAKVQRRQVASASTSTFMTAPSAEPPAAYGSLTSADCGTIYVQATITNTVTASNAPRSVAARDCVPTTVTLTATMVNTATDPFAFGSLTSTASSAEPPSLYGSLIAGSSTSTISSVEPIVSAEPPGAYGSLTEGYLGVLPTNTNTNPSPLETGVLASLSEQDLMVSGTFQHIWYFAALYLPSILAVLVKEAWSSVGSCAKLMEPFYRLSPPDGALASKTLCSEYLASAMSLDSIKDILAGNFHLLMIVLVNLVMSVLAPLATESMTVQFLGEGTDGQGNYFRDDPRWFVSKSLVRGLQAVLSFVSACIALIVIFGLGRRTGLSANPSSIASMATLLSDPNVVHDIREIDPNASRSSTSKVIADKRFTLVDHVDEDGSSRYGLLRVGGDIQETRRMLPHTATPQKATTAPYKLGEKDLTRVQRGLFSKILDVLLIFLLISLLGVTIAYRLDFSNSGFNQFFNSQKFGPRFILSAAASFITLGLQSMEQEVRHKSPYRHLASRHASADTTILRRVNGTALTNLLPCLRLRDWFGFCVALTAVLGNALIIAVAGVPYSSAAILPAFYASVDVTCILCTLMLITVVCVFVWRKQNHKLRIPHEPNDILIRVLMSLCNDGNRLRAMFSQIEDASDDGLSRHCCDIDHRYWAGWIIDSNGWVRWCVDREGEASLVD